MSNLDRMRSSNSESYAASAAVAVAAASTATTRQHSYHDVGRDGVAEATEAAGGSASDVPVAAAMPIPSTTRDRGSSLRKSRNTSLNMSFSEMR